MRLVVLVTLLAGLVLLLAGVSQAVLAWHTKAQAERNILNAPRALARWNTAFVNPETHLVRRNAVVTCTGLGRSKVGRFNRFACIFRYKQASARMIYWAQFGNGFELRGRKKH